jgi:uncharacterized membrane protein
LSPAVNDFYTALAAADALAEITLRHSGNWIDSDRVPVSARHPRFELPGQDFRGLFGDPFDAFRQAAAGYPLVSIRMIRNYGRVICAVRDAGGSPQLVCYLEAAALGLRDHALARAETDQDRADIRAAFDDARTDAA